MLIEVCDTCICRAANNAKSETCKDPHMQSLHALSYVENSQHFVFSLWQIEKSHWHRLKCCACHDFARPELPARQHPIPLDSCEMLPLPRKPTLRCTECCACHNFGNGISKVLRLPRFRAPRAARATTSQPLRQLPNAAPATQTHTQMHRMLRLPRLRQRHLQSAAPATNSRAPGRARDNIPAL